MFTERFMGGMRILRTWEVEINAGMNGSNPKAALDALRLYEGDIRIRDAAGNLISRQSEDDFYKNKDAYRTLNALLFAGTCNEYSRIEKEGKKLKPVFMEQIEETIRLYCRIFGLMCQNLGSDNRTEIIVKRVERESSLTLLQKGQTISFFSASKTSFQKDFAEKDGIILLEVYIPPHVPYLDFEKSLGVEYQSMEEREILLPPFVSITIQEETLQHIEKRRILDIKKNPPKGKYRIHAVKFPAFMEESDGYCLAGQMEKEILAEREIATDAINAMNQRKWNQDFSSYCLWKEKLQTYLRYRFLEIYSEFSFCHNHTAQEKSIKNIQL